MVLKLKSRTVLNPLIFTGMPKCFFRLCYLSMSNIFLETLSQTALLHARRLAGHRCTAAVERIPQTVSSGLMLSNLTTYTIRDVML